MKRIRSTKTMVLALSLALAVPALAAGDVTWTKGEVKKVDLEQGKVTVRHEEIKNLDMPPMTMVFTTSDPAMLQKLKPGEAAEFEFVDQNGRIVIKQIKE